MLKKILQLPSVHTKSLATCAGLLALSLSYLAPLTAQAEPEPVTACSAEPTEMKLSYGMVVDCKINVAGDQDVFNFVGTAKSVVVVSLLNKAGACNNSYPCPVAKIYAPGNSTPLATLDPVDKGDAQEVTLPASGTYTIRVAEFRNDRSASYRIGLERLFPASPNATPLAFGFFSGNQRLDPTLDQDFYTFSAYKDSVVRLTLGDVTSGCNNTYPCPGAVLYGPDRKAVATLGYGSETKTFKLLQEGLYTLRLDEYQHNQTETYNLELNCQTPPAGHNTCEIAPDTTTCNDLTPTLVGTTGNDILLGTSGDDVIAGLGGNDRISGLGGDDIICGDSDQGGGGYDTLLGGDGDDQLFVNGGINALFGDAGNDALKGGKSRDGLFGGVGDDTLDAQGGDDVLVGGAGDDVLRGGAGANDVCDKQADDLKAATGCEINDIP